jgi:hypothetical protein
VLAACAKLRKVVLDDSTAPILPLHNASNQQEGLYLYRPAAIVIHAAKGRAAAATQLLKGLTTRIKFVRQPDRPYTGMWDLNGMKNRGIERRSFTERGGPWPHLWAVQLTTATTNLFNVCTSSHSGPTRSTQVVSCRVGERRTDGRYVVALLMFVEHNQQEKLQPFQLALKC